MSWWCQSEKEKITYSDEELFRHCMERRWALIEYWNERHLYKPGQYESLKARLSQVKNKSECFRFRTAPPGKACEPASPGHAEGWICSPPDEY